MATSPDGNLVMVVEDSEEVREFFAQTLRRNGYHVVAAGDGAEALALLRRAPADLIVLNLCLPDMDGRQLLRHLRMGPYASDTPVVVVTGQPPALCAQLDVETEHVLYKPVAASRLVTTVEALLGRGRPVGGECPMVGVGPLLAGSSESKIPYRFAN